MDRFEADYNTFKGAVAAISEAKDLRTVNELDNKIGASLHALQRGVLVLAGEAKQKVDSRRAEL